MKYKDQVGYLGCGDYPMSGCVNVDIRPLPGVDVVSDVMKLPFEDGELRGIDSRNLVEHFSRFEVGPLLKEWARVVKKGGFVKLETVEMGKTMDKWRNMPEENLLDALYGAQTYPENFHKMLMTEDVLRGLFAEAGLQVVEVNQFENREIPRIIIVGEKL